MLGRMIIPSWTDEWGTAALLGSAGFVLIGALPVAVHARQSPNLPLVFDSVTVVDVEQGKLLPDQRVVIEGNRIQAMGNVAAVSLPPRARVVGAGGQYLIPGLWDMHVHWGTSPDDVTRTPLAYEMFLAHGGTGFRDVGTAVSLDSLQKWHREILAGARVGPPRQVLAGGLISDKPHCLKMADVICVADSSEARHVVDSLKAAGIDMLKFYDLSPEMYFTLAAEARRVGLPFGGHLGFLPMYGGRLVPPAAAADSGASVVDHMLWGVDSLCYHPDAGASVERCRSLAERFQRHNTWSLPNVVHVAKAGGPKDSGLSGEEAYPIIASLLGYTRGFWYRQQAKPDWLHDGAQAPSARGHADLSIPELAGLPILAGTDLGAGMWERDSITIQGINLWDDSSIPIGVSLEGELALLVSWGMTPLGALRAATLNPAKMLHATDSLGTVAPGKLADLVLLDANPLADITNVAKIYAVVANGRYYDRIELNGLLDHVRSEILKATVIVRDWRLHETNR